MTKTLHYILSVVFVLYLSLIVTLYLAPSRQHYYAGDLFAAILLALLLFNVKIRLKWVFEAVKPLLPILILITYVFFVEYFDADGYNGFYVRQLTYGLIPFFLFYIIFRYKPLIRREILVLSLFIIPGLVQLFYMYLDIILAFIHHQIDLTYSSKQGLLESIKNIPRVGYRYLSVALIHLLIGGWLLRSVRLRFNTNRFSWSIFAIGMLSLALVNARAAYASLLIAGILMTVVLGKNRILNFLSTALNISGLYKIMLICLIGLTLGVGYSAGKSRWLSMGYSFHEAVVAVFESNKKIADRPYVNNEFWKTPKDTAKCYLEGRFRCKVDQSSYLRMAWLLTGLKSLIAHPFGIGYSINYLGKLWGVTGEQGKYQHADSFLVENMVVFGVPGLLLYVWLWWCFGYSLHNALKLDVRHQNLLIGVGGVIFICIGRSLVDVFSHGLWRYFMALLGVYYGLLHSELLSEKKG